MVNRNFFAKNVVDVVFVNMGNRNIIVKIVDVGSVTTVKIIETAKNVGEKESVTMGNLRETVNIAVIFVNMGCKNTIARNAVGMVYATTGNANFSVKNAQEVPTVNMENRNTVARNVAGKVFVNMGKKKDIVENAVELLFANTTNIKRIVMNVKKNGNTQSNTPTVFG